jgi:hypothetical protein
MPEAVERILSPTRLPIPPSRPGLILTDVPFPLVSRAVTRASNHQVPRIRMNKLGSKMLAALLVTLMAAISLAEQESTLMVVVPGQPAGCHQHGATPPASTPVSYRCCQTGHDSAMPQSSFVTQLSLSQLVTTSASSNAPVAMPIQGSLKSLMISSPDPPHTIPLRV